MNYTELTAAIKDYTNNTGTDFVAAIPTFVKQAEQRIYRAVNLPVNRKNVSGSMTDGNAYLAMPTDFLFPLSLSITSSSNQIFLLNKDSNFIRSTYPNASTKGTPKYYGIFASDTFIIGPTPDSNYTTELHYYYQPNSIVTDSTSWLGTNADTVLLYGSLVEAYVYMKGEPDMMQEYEKRFAEAIIAMKNFGEAKEVTDAYRTGLVIRDKA